jgi:hypothetical protein
VKSVDQPVRFVEFVPQGCHPTAGDQRCVTLDPSRADFRGFHLLRDFVDVRVQRLQKFSRLGCVGVIDHVGIIAPTTTLRALGSTQQTAQQSHSMPCPGNSHAVAY